MAVEVRKKGNESAEVLARRFGQRVMESGTINQAKIIRFKKSKPNKRARKVSALRKSADKAKREYLTKVGLIKPTKFTRRRY